MMTPKDLKYLNTVVLLSANTNHQGYLEITLISLGAQHFSYSSDERGMGACIS